MNLSLVNDHIYRKIIDVFFKNFEIPKNLIQKSYFSKIYTSQNNVKIKKIISCFPSFKTLLKTINTLDFNDEKNLNEIFFIKISLDLLQKYFLENDYPLYKVNNANKFENYIKKCLNIIIKFYEKVNQANMCYINEKLSSDPLKSF